MRYLALLSLLLIGCGEDVGAQDPNPPPRSAFPPPIRLNDYQDGTIITNGTSYWKTENELNKDLVIRSSHCLVDGKIRLGREYCYVPNAVIDRRPAQVYRLNIGRPTVGAIYTILGEYRATNPNSFAPLVGSLIILSSDQDETGNFTHHEVPGTNPIVVPYTGGNCIKEQHHCTDVKVGTFMFDQAMADYFDARDVWVIWVAWSHSTRYWEGSKNVIIEPNDGSLSVLRKD